MSIATNNISARFPRKPSKFGRLFARIECKRSHIIQVILFARDNTYSLIPGALHSVTDINRVTLRWRTESRAKDREVDLIQSEKETKFPFLLQFCCWFLFMSFQNRGIWQYMNQIPSIFFTVVNQVALWYSEKKTTSYHK